MIYKVETESPCIWEHLKECMLIKATVYLKDIHKAPSE